MFNRISRAALEEEIQILRSREEVNRRELRDAQQDVSRYARKVAELERTVQSLQDRERMREFREARKRHGAVEHRGVV